jgi:outer membrane protein TolC
LAVRRDRKKGIFVKALRLFALLVTASLVAVPDVASQDQSPPRRATPALTSGVFLGGVPSGPRTNEVITITVLDAMNRALEHNLGVLTAEEQLGHARGTRWKELSALLPNLNARISESRLQNNLQAFGFGSFGSAFAANIPTIVGPFNVFDARVYLSQAVVDLGAINNTRSESHNVNAAQYTYQGTRDLVVWVAGTLYLQALAADARVESARAQQQTAQTLYNQAVDLRQSGLVAGIDVLRSEVELNVQINRATTAANDAEKAKLQLARVIGLPLGQSFRLDPELPDLPNPDLTVDQAIERAFETRADYRAALERVRAAEATRQAVVGEALPAVRLNADFGDIGLSPSDSHGTFSVTGAVQIPIFQGGRTRGRVLEADADVRSRRNEAEDLKASIYYEVRTAYLDLQATSDQLQVATKARDLAAQQLTQSRDRFAAGVASNIEIVQAQETVAIANEQYISALYGYDLAKGALIRGVGTAEATLRQFLGGTR